MKAIITTNGMLDVERGKRYKEQICPYNEHMEARCGDWYPLFGEPHQMGDLTHLELCQAVLTFEEFLDERPQPETEHLSFDESPEDGS